ncbi:hypothetical protein K492DRAFT_74888 [Lichtheimia hyalospora FSU 10163]|nr:hypothetical protein K492DRAFT_74888 [Lichtheimia hyalospora FSU 10163]
MRRSQGVLFHCYGVPRLVQQTDLKALACLASPMVWSSASSKVPYVGLCTTYTVKMERCYMEVFSKQQRALCWLMYPSYIKGKGSLLYEEDS